MLENVEADGLRQGSALSDGHNVAFFHVLPAGRAVHGHVLVPLLKP